MRPLLTRVLAAGLGLSGGACTEAEFTFVPIEDAKSAILVSLPDGQLPRAFAYDPRDRPRIDSEIVDGRIFLALFTESLSSLRIIEGSQDILPQGYFPEQVPRYFEGTFQAGDSIVWNRAEAPPDWFESLGFRRAPFVCTPFKVQQFEMPGTQTALSSFALPLPWDDTAVLVGMRTSSDTRVFRVSQTGVEVVGTWPVSVVSGFADDRGQKLYFLTRGGRLAESRDGVELSVTASIAVGSEVAVLQGGHDGNTLELYAGFTDGSVYSSRDQVNWTLAFDLTTADEPDGIPHLAWEAPGRVVGAIDGQLRITSFLGGEVDVDSGVFTSPRENITSVSRIGDSTYVASSDGALWQKKGTGWNSLGSAGVGLYSAIALPDRALFGADDGLMVEWELGEAPCPPVPGVIAAVVRNSARLGDGGVLVARSHASQDFPDADLRVSVVTP